MTNEEQAKKAADEFLAAAEKVYKDRKVIINGREYEFEKTNFKDSTRLAAFAEKMQGMAWFGSQEFHGEILPIILNNVRYKTMLLSKHDNLLDSDEFMLDSVRLLTIAVAVLCYPLLAGAK